MLQLFSRQEFEPAVAEHRAQRQARGVQLLGTVRGHVVLPIESLFLLKVVPEVIDPVVGSFQLGCIKGQIRTI
jgi:hypothetical protein